VEWWQEDLVKRPTPTTRTVTSLRIERRLAAILAADVAGYSRLMVLTRSAR
jgi:hypothetical protein